MARAPKQGTSGATLPPEALGEDPSRRLPASGGCWPSAVSLVSWLHHCGLCRLLPREVCGFPWPSPAWLCLRVASSSLRLCPNLPLLVRTPGFGLGLILTQWAWSSLGCVFRDPVSKSGHVLSFWVLCVWSTHSSRAEGGRRRQTLPCSWRVPRAAGAVVGRTCLPVRG